MSVRFSELRNETTHYLDLIHPWSYRSIKSSEKTNQSRMLHGLVACICFYVSYHLISSYIGHSMIPSMNRNRCSFGIALDHCNALLSNLREEEGMHGKNPYAMLEGRQGKTLKNSLYHTWKKRRQNPIKSLCPCLMLEQEDRQDKNAFPCMHTYSSCLHLKEVSCTVYRHIFNT